MVFREMKLRAVEKALIAHGCQVLRNTGDHTVWKCPCGAHRAPVPRHRDISPGVVQSVGKQMACLPEGWLQ
ncbi:type II toxin-antitoxin system HicA family toxin [Pseudonocardia xinjiangensis]|nr:type II toxin-antitoxin system HicA family toxin [Pseudonocardia xinjiangensis]